MATQVTGLILLSLVLLISYDCNGASVYTSTGGKQVGDFTCPEDKGYHPHDILCHAYYICYQKQPYLGLCPSHELFDVEILQCAEASKVNCGKRNRPDLKPEITTSPSPDSFNSTDNAVKPTTTDDRDDEDVECPEPEGLYPHPKDKQQFIQCVGGYPHIMRCPATLVFDDILKVCVWPK